MLYFIRHAESLFNENPNNHELNVQLSVNGIKQCAALGNKLKEITFDLAIISPLKRCMQTFKLSGLKTKNIVVLSECREYRQNECDFMNGESIIYESESQIIDRVNGFKTILKNLFKYYRRIAVITHADFIFYLTCKNISGEYYGKWIDNTEYIVVNLL